MAALAPEPEDHEISAPVAAAPGDRFQADLVGAEAAGVVPGPEPVNGALAFRPAATQATAAPEPLVTEDTGRQAHPPLAPEPAAGPASPPETAAGDF